ncbi:hypothetical protein CBM2637_A200544 [Cupriavidus taiwanensis]|nr:hypothetical protein CBM2637_A200544 [Cupriavidus taiwanensis]SPA51077.1 protein of unknown function [Cupriavidus taiwanensis]
MAGHAGDGGAAAAGHHSRGGVAGRGSAQRLTLPSRVTDKRPRRPLVRRPGQRPGSTGKEPACYVSIVSPTTFPCLN